MKDLLYETLVGYVELTLKTGHKLVGKIPFDTFNESDIQIVFLPQENFDKFYSRAKENSVLFDNIKEFVFIIPFNLIESYEIKLNEIKGLKTENDKPLPQWFKIEFHNIGKLGTINVRYSLPDSNKVFDLGNLKIGDGIITLPISFVFLSYAKEDKEIVKFTMETLHNYGIITWFDEKDLLPGDNWEQKIENSIEKADYVFIFFSSNTIGRQGYKNKEIRLALEQKFLKPFDSRYIIPILVDDVKLPRELNDIQWIKVNEENWLSKILTSIGKDPNKKYWL